MSTKGELYTVDDESMSSQGSVNDPTQRPIAPVVPTDTWTHQSAVGPHIPVAATEKTVLVVPEATVSRQEAQEAFEQVSKAIDDMTSEHGSIKSDIQELAGHLAQAQQAKEKEIAAVQLETLSQTSSVRSAMEEKFSAVQSQQMQAQATAVEAKMAGERALLETEKVKLQHQAALMQTEQKFQKQVQTTELVARRAESEIKSVAKVLPKHQQYMEALRQHVEKTEDKMNVAAATATQAVSKMQGAVETVPEHSKQIQDLQIQLQNVLRSLEEQRRYTKGLEGDLQKANQRLINAESTVKATKTANEAMQAGNCR